MSEKQNTDEAATAGDGGGLDPRQAAELLERTRRQAERQFDIRPPLLTLLAALVILVAYGAVWLSVRDQHPYDGPSNTALAVLYSTLIVWVVLTSVVLRRATSGVGGRASRQRRIEGLVFAAIWMAVYVFQGALYHAGASKAIVYGIYPAAAPLIIVGAAAAAHAAARENLPLLGLALAGVAVATGGAFAGPAGVWAVIAVGGCAVLLVYGVAKLRLRDA